MAMFHILANIRNRWNPSLHLEVVNFNHKLRELSDEEVINFWKVIIIVVTKKIIILFNRKYSLEVGVEYTI